MKKGIVIIALVTLFLTPTVFSNTIITSAQTYGRTQATYTLLSSGTIQMEAPNNTVNATALILQIKDGYYQVINTATQEPIIGGPDNLAGVNGTSFSAVAQAAENSLQTGGSLEIAAGNYISDGTVSIKGNTTILGQGDSTFIQQKAGIATHISLLDVTRTSNVEIFNLWLDGNRANQFDTGDEMRHGIITFVAQNVWIHNVKVTNFTETGWDSAWCNNCTIENSILTGSGDGDIWIDIDSTHQIARNNICNKIFAVDFGGLMKNIEITSNQANFIELYQGNTGVPRDITLSDNTIIASEMFGIYTQGCLNVIIRNNTVIGNWGFTDTGILIACGANFTITSNTVTNCGNGVKSGTYSTPSQHTIIKNDLKMNKIPINDNITQTMDYIKYNLGVDISSWDEIP